MEAVCDAIVPGSARVRPAVYVDALLARMEEAPRAAALAAFASLADGEIGEHVGTPEFLQVRALAIEAFYSDFVAPGVDATGAWAEIDFNTSSRDAPREGLVLPRDRMKRALRRRGGRLRRGWRSRRRRARGARPERAPAGGRPAPDRGRLHALGGEGDARSLVADPVRADRRRRRRRGRAARRSLRRRLDDDQHEGGAARAREGLAKWHEASGLVGAGGTPFGRPTSSRTTSESSSGSASASEPTGRRACTPSSPASARSAPSSTPVRSYTDANCMSCGSCLQGCPTNAGKSTLNTYIHDAWAAGRLELRADARVERVVIEDGEAAGVEYVDGDGTLTRVDAGAVVVAAGTLNTPQLLLRSGLPDSPSSRLVGRNLGFHPARLVFGLFDEPQDAHMVYPITAHAMGHQHDEDGGFVIEATTIMDPIGFATTVEDENGPLWGAALVETLRGFRRWVGLLVMVNDDNNGSVRARRERRGVVRGGVHGGRARAHGRRIRLHARRAAGGRRVERPLDRAGHDARAGDVPDGQRPGAVGRRRGRAVVGRQAALRRRRLARAADALGQPVADDHGARDPPRRPPRRRPARVPLRDRGRPRPRAPLARRAADAEAGREPPLLPGDPRHGGRRRERRLGLPARLRRLRAIVAEADRGRAGGGRARRLPHAQRRGPRAPGRGTRGGRSRGRLARRRSRSRSRLQLPRSRRPPARALLRVRALRGSARAAAGAQEPAAALPGPRRRRPPPRPRQLPRRRPRREPRLRSRSTSACG